MRDNRCKLKQERFRPDVNKNFFIVRHWNRMPREFLQAPSLKFFKTKLDKFWSNQI